MLAARTLLWLIVGALLAGPAFLVLDFFGLAGNPVCLTDVHERIFDLSGFDYEVSETGCSALAHDDAISVSVSKVAQRQRRKILLFKYVPAGVTGLPVIIPIDEHTVQISISRVSSLFCRTDKWDALTVKYDIGVIDYPDSRARPPEC